MPKIKEILYPASELLKQHGVALPHREAASLLAFALGKTKTFLLTHDDYELSDAEQTAYQNLLERRAAREPFQYITGRQEFYGLDFEVAPGVLIPRPETEIIVENALEILKTSENPRFCEVGVGSGCISVSILYHSSAATAIGLDVSDTALGISQKNAEKYAVLNRLKLIESNVFDALADEKLDLIVSNPPYIPREDIENLQAEVRDFEPLNALTDGGDGLSIIEKIAADAPKFLKSGGFLLMEIGFGQATAVESLFENSVWQTIEILPDLQGIPRTVRARII